MSTESELIQLIDKLHEEVEVGSHESLMNAAMALEIFLLPLIERGRAAFVPNGTKGSLYGLDEHQMFIEDLPELEFWTRGTSAKPLTSKEAPATL